MFLDVHNHVIPAAVLRLAERDPGFGISNEDGWLQSPYHVPFPLARTFHDPAEKLAHLDSGGLWGAVVSPAPVLFGYDLPPDRAGVLSATTNEGLAEFCAHAPERLHWLATLPMQAPDLAAEAYRQAVAAGAVGAAIGTSIAGRRLDSGEFGAFWAAADAIGRPVLVHPAFNSPHPALGDWYLQNVIGNPLETTIVVERLICAGVFDKSPRVRLLLMHGGGFLPYQTGRLVHARGVRPELTDTPADAWSYLGRLFFDTITHDAQALRYLIDRVGLDHVVLGTDLPFDMGLQTPAATLKEALDDAELQAVAVRNPRALFGLD